MKSHFKLFVDIRVKEQTIKSLRGIGVGSRGARGAVAPLDFWFNLHILKAGLK